MSGTVRGGVRLEEHLVPHPALDGEVDKRLHHAVEELAVGAGADCARALRRHEPGRRRVGRRHTCGEALLFG
eukprot:5042348-Prymnesium_polylepis.2